MVPIATCGVTHPNYGARQGLEPLTADGYGISSAALGIQEDWRQLGLFQILTVSCALVSLKSKAELLYMSSQGVRDGSDVLGGNS